MKLLKFLLLSFLLSLAQLSLAEDYVELIDLSGYEEGDIPTYLLGEQITVRQEVKDGKVIKFVSGQASDGKINYNIPNLSKDFEIIFELPLEFYDDLLISFISSDQEAKFSFKWGRTYGMQLGDNPPANNAYNRSNDFTINTLKIKLENGNVKTYVNSEFFQSMTLEQPDKIYNELLITGIDKNEKIYSIKVNNLGSSSTPITTPSSDGPKITLEEIMAAFEKGKQEGMQQCTGGTTTTNDDCIANYSNNGELHIPCVNVPGAFGKIEMYDVWMKQRSGNFVFDLDLDRIQPK